MMKKLCLCNLSVHDSEIKENPSSFACSTFKGACALLEIDPLVLSQRMKEEDLGKKMV